MSRSEHPAALPRGVLLENMPDPSMAPPQPNPGRNPEDPVNYAAFLERKAHASDGTGFPPLWMPDFLFDFQRELVTWALARGRAALFADCGLGKTPMQLVWADNVARKTGGRVLILTPLAVAHQTVAEAQKFGVHVHLSRDGVPGGGITITNYEQLHRFDPADFVGAVCDESSILKSFDGARRGEITLFMRKLPYRLLATATAAPNDFIELGTSSEALGEMGQMDMLNRFFKNDQNNSATGRMRGEVVRWRFKGHAERPFWRWVCSWARAIRRPSDLGFEDGAFVLPPLVEENHTVESVLPPEGMLFNLPATSMREEREERRRTIQERCEQVARMVDTGDLALVWCHLNDEGDLLAKLIPDAVQVSGSDSDDTKSERLLAFANGETRVLITKPKIGAWGLNFQRCAHVVTFPSHSFEQYYQSVRRCWRFGQTRPVKVDVVSTEGEARVLKNLNKKAAQADRMFDHLVEEMRNELRIQRTNPYTVKEEVPSWLS